MVTILQPTPAAAPTTHDALSLSMFLAGALMAFTPLLYAAVVLAVWWRQRTRTGGVTPGAGDDGAPMDP